MKKSLYVIVLIISIISFSDGASAMNNITLDEAYLIAQRALDDRKENPKLAIDRNYTDDLGYGWLFLLEVKDHPNEGWFGIPIDIAVTKDEGIPYFIMSPNTSNESIWWKINNDRKRRNVPPVGPEPVSGSK